MGAVARRLMPPFSNGLCVEGLLQRRTAQSKTGKRANAKRAREFFPGSFQLRSDDLHRRLKIHQVQTMTPVALVQVLADCECTALALQVCGGPATIVAVMVTFCEGVKP